MQLRSNEWNYSNLIVQGEQPQIIFFLEPDSGCRGKEKEKQKGRRNNKKAATGS